MFKKVLKRIIYVLITIIILLFLGWIIWNDTVCKGTLGENTCSMRYWWMLGF